MTVLKVTEPREQSPMEGAPSDRWIDPAGACVAEFFRDEDGYLVRFPGEVDFSIDQAGERVSASPVPGVGPDRVRRLFENSIQPLVGNHRGGLFLHGSAVAIDGAAIAFLGHSRSGKTTLAGAFARSGRPFITEDVVDLERQGQNYLIHPKSSGLRLFADSAEFLFGAAREADLREGKLAYDGDGYFDFHDGPAPLRAMFLIGKDHTANFSVSRLPDERALTSLMQHAFILDVEDRARMKAHFARLADLAEHVPVFTLGYPRDYAVLPDVMDAVLNAQANLEGA